MFVSENSCGNAVRKHSFIIKYPEPAPFSDPQKLGFGPLAEKKVKKESGRLSECVFHHFYHYMYAERSWPRV